MQLDYLLIDVFTSRPFGGSRLTLFTDARELPPELMQKLALEMGCGETAFVLPGHRPDENRARLRVFTPSVEIPFAGHSVLGATFAFDTIGRRDDRGRDDVFTWELEAGNYQVSTRGEDSEAVYSLLHDDPVFLGQYFHRSKVARTLGIPESEIAITGLPCEVISTGLPIHIVPVGSLDAVQAITLHGREADAIARDLGFGDLFVFTPETVDPEATVHCRMFAPHFGIPEDPASGAATGSLVAYLIKHRLVRAFNRIEMISEQGLEMGRPSRLVVEAGIENGQARDIRVGGHCVMVGSGQVSLD